MGGQIGGLLQLRLYFFYDWGGGRAGVRRALSRHQVAAIRISIPTYWSRQYHLWPPRSQTNPLSSNTTQLRNHLWSQGLRKHRQAKGGNHIQRQFCTEPVELLLLGLSARVQVLCVAKCSQLCWDASQEQGNGAWQREGNREEAGNGGAGDHWV